MGALLRSGIRRRTLEADDEDCLRSVAYNPCGEITEEQLENLLRTMEKDYGLQFVATVPADGSSTIGYTLSEEDCRARIGALWREGEDAYTVWMEIRRLPVVPQAQEE